MSFRLTTFSVFTFLVVATTAQADCKADIQTILKNIETSGPYRMEMSVAAAGDNSTMSAEIIMPHSMHMKGEDMELTMTPNGVWMSQGGAMQKMPDGMKEQIQSMIRQGINLGVQAVDAVECLGSTSFEGGTFNLYKYKAEAEFMGIKSSSFVEMYVNGAGQPEWMVVDGEAMGIKSLTKQRLIFDDSITIADPK